MNEIKLLKPEKLLKGDTIGIISPAGSVQDVSKFKNVQIYFEEKGYKVLVSKHAKEQEGYLAGSDENRLKDLHAFFKNDKVKAILCSRGGYGTMRLLEKIDYDIIAQNPKIFMGYSDITALHCSIYKKTGLVTFHGPLALSDFGEEINNFTEKNFFKILTEKIEIPYTFQNPFEYECLKKGSTEAKLTGGNLSVLCALLGTKYFPDLKGKILLLEDIGEPLYKIDRLLTQLELSGVLNIISGLLFGKFTNIGQQCCSENLNYCAKDKFNKSNQEENPEKQAIELLFQKTKNYNIPIGYGFPASHHKIKTILPLEVNYCFNSSKGELKLTENYFL
ncbi:MAG: LD-carboxypeptidase [Candidatus Gastranaerophilaceae bacterium]|jgi:muramoyltetrapeptide carboxypeptidase